MSAVMVYTFVCYPSVIGDLFEPFLMDVPTLGNEDVAARRAWWTAFHRLGPQGVEPEQFSVCEWDARANGPGRLVTAGGVAA